MADHAMYICKHDAYIAQEASGFVMITPDELRLALINGDFRLAYDPSLDFECPICGAPPTERCVMMSGNFGNGAV